MKPSNTNMPAAAMYKVMPRSEPVLDLKHSQELRIFLMLFLPGLFITNEKFELKNCKRCYDLYARQWLILTIHLSLPDKATLALGLRFKFNAEQTPLFDFTRHNHTGASFA